MNITDEDRDALAIFLRDLPSGVVVEGQSVPMLSGLPNWDPPVWEYIADAILASDVFARIVRGAEPEWEYGLVSPDALPGEYGRDDRAHLVSRNREHVERQHRRGHPSIQLMRRRQAGEWEDANNA